MTIVLPLDVVEARRVLGDDAHLIERLIDARLPLPAVEDRQIAEYFITQFHSTAYRHGLFLTDDQEQVLRRLFSSVLREWVTTLRRAKQLLNSLDVALHLSRGDLHLIDLVVLEVLRLGYPRSYGRMPDYWDALTSASTDRLFIGSESTDNEERRRLLNEWLMIDDGLPPSRTKGRLMDALFPGSDAFLRGGARPRYGFEFAAEGRIASPSNFPRYFLYRPELSDVPNEAFIPLLHAAALGVDEATEALKDLVSDHGEKGSVLFDRLLQRTLSLDGEAALNLGTAIACCAGTLSRERQFLQESPRERSRSVLWKLANNLTDAQSALEQFVTASSDLEYAAELVAFLRPDRNHVFERWDAVDTSEIIAHLGSRALADYKSIPDLGLPARVLSIIGSDVATHITRRLLTESLVDVHQVVRWFVSEAYGPAALRTPEELNREWLKSTFEPAFISEMVASLDDESPEARLMRSAGFGSEANSPSA